MIAVTRLNEQPMYLNALLIETLEETPDTVITLTTGKKHVVKESVAEVIEAMKTFYTDIHIFKHFGHHDLGGSHVSE